MLSRSGRNQRGLSLVELMVGIVVGMIVVAGAIAIYVTTVRGGTYAIRAARLNQELRAVMDVMVADIRRAGYWGQAFNGSVPAGSANPFAARSGTHTDLAISAAGDCILYAYDRDANGSVGATPVEVFGFKLSNNEIKMLKSVRDDYTDASTCDDSHDINKWEGVTNDVTVVIDSLSFSTEGSQCLNLRKNLSWTLITANTNLVACSASGADIEMNPRFDGTEWTEPPPAYVAPSSGDAMIESRQVVITLVGHHKDDAATALTLRQTVKVQNDRAFTFTAP